MTPVNKALARCCWIWVSRLGCALLVLGAPVTSTGLNSEREPGLMETLRLQLKWRLTPEDGRLLVRAS